MKILFAAYKHDPLDGSTFGGADSQFVSALKANHIDVRITRPVTDPPVLIERMIRRFLKFITHKRYLKYDITSSIRSSRMVSKTAIHEKPDLIFTLYPPPLVFYRGNTPCVFRTDATIIGVFEENPEFYNLSRFLRNINLMMEKSVIKKSELIITHSRWSENVLIDRYQVSKQKILVFPNPSSLPVDLIPEALDFYLPKIIENQQIRLLFIGTDPYRKGLDIAKRTIRHLIDGGVDVLLLICGIEGENEEGIEYRGYLRRNSPKQLEEYLHLLKTSHLLIHPARFDPAPRVTSEAAAFGTPTITNDTGGLGTSVKDGVSGVVLLKGSPPESYAKAIRDLVEDPERYYALCQSTRRRYEQELNWDVAGSRLVNILKQVVINHNNNNLK